MLALQLGRTMENFIYFFFSKFWKFVEIELQRMNTQPRALGMKWNFIYEISIFFLFQI